MNKRSFGSEGERLAAAFLEQGGYRLLERNYRFGRMGEVDIIAAQDEFICFIEVKTRTVNTFGRPSEAVGRRKQETLRKLAWTYLKHKGLADRNIRFDIVEINGDRKGDELINIKINLIRNAF